MTPMTIKLTPKIEQTISQATEQILNLTDKINSDFN